MAGKNAFAAVAMHDYTGTTSLCGKADSKNIMVAEGYKGNEDWKCIDMFSVLVNVIAGKQDQGNAAFRRSSFISQEDGQASKQGLRRQYFTW